MFYLKSSMDRFIDQSTHENDNGGKNLKSSMDRFIEKLLRDGQSAS